MKSLFAFYILAAATLLAGSPSALAQGTKTAPKDASVTATSAPEMTTAIATNAEADVITNIRAADDHSKYLELLEQAQLIEKLQGKGPFTVFAPTNQAFATMPAGMLMFMTDKDPEALQKMLGYHVVAAKINGRKIMQDIKMGKGKATYRTISGARLVLQLNDAGRVVVTDDMGNSANLGAYDLIGKNGLVHVIDKVMIPQEFN